MKLKSTMIMIYPKQPRWNLQVANDSDLINDIKKNLKPKQTLSPIIIEGIIL